MCLKAGGGEEVGSLDGVSYIRTGQGCLLASPAAGLSHQCFHLLDPVPTPISW